eukprot:TRINITY_DN2336_c0_g1_i5.p1 TRINITY_DN2336_c0_g1~~TRINITY_DN2336_c0_g1_i5.p1  ORF type:complete len:208 (-),score=55.66 TRINITY_DN2336_c0_g1_i5:151-774(-)
MDNGIFVFILILLCIFEVTLSQNSIDVYVNCISSSFPIDCIREKFNEEDYNDLLQICENSTAQDACIFYYLQNLFIIEMDTDLSTRFKGNMKKKLSSLEKSFVQKSVGFGIATTNTFKRIPEKIGKGVETSLNATVRKVDGKKVMSGLAKGFETSLNATVRKVDGKKVMSGLAKGVETSLNATVRKVDVKGIVGWFRSRKSNDTSPS